MRVAEVMSRGVDAIDPAATVQQAAEQMGELDVGAVFVGTDGALQGVLTDRDIILRLVIEGRHPAEVPVSAVMSAQLFACREDDNIETVLGEMRERQVRRMPVLAEDGRPVGVVTLSDIAKAVGGPEQAMETLREIFEPRRERRASDRENDGDTDTAGNAASGNAAA
jgi:CBS domain-containing protein